MQVEEQFNRFKDAPWFPQRNELAVIGGAGGIGSWLTLFLSRAGFKIFLQDFDVIETHNLGGQLFRFSDVGKTKVGAVDSIITTFCGSSINYIVEPIGQTTPVHHFMFSAFDNMQARKDLFNIWKRSHTNCPITPIFIDGRIEMEQLQIFCVTPENMDEYERNHLFDDSEVEDLPCTMKQTSHIAAMVASHMTAFFTNHIANIYEGEVYREVPFYFEHFVPANLTE